MQTTTATVRAGNDGSWNLAKIVQELSVELPSSAIHTKKLAGNEISYLPWYLAARLLNKYAPGWQWEIARMEVAGENLILVGRLTIVASDGIFVREATGICGLNETGYGDVSSNAESMAFRRAAAKFGLALYLYDKSKNKKPR